MTKILGTLVVAVLVGLGAGDYVQKPPYKQYAAAVVEAAKTLLINIVSMEGHIPLLDDARRHYAEIVHVVNYIGQKQASYPYFPYNEVYYKYLNTSVAEGISNPENVIAEIKNFLDDVNNKTKVVKDLIDSCPNYVPEFFCNEAIHDTIKENQPVYGVAAIIFLDAGRAATEFNKKSGKFDEVSKDLNADQYVRTSPDDMRVLVAEVGNLYHTLNDLPKLLLLRKN